MMNVRKIDGLERIAFFGSGKLVVDSALFAQSKNIDVAVFAAPRHLQDTVECGDRAVSYEEYLRSHGIKFFSCKDVNNAQELKSFVKKNTIGIGMGEVFTFTKETIALFSNNLFDFMIIPLPKYRGGAHYTWQILRNEKQSGWYIQEINEDMVPGVYDSGRVLKYVNYTIDESARCPQQFHDRAEEEGLKLFKEFISEIMSGKSFPLFDVDESEAMYFPRLATLQHGFINWAWTVEEISRFVCAFDAPYPGASTFLNGERVFLKDSRVDYSEGIFHPFITGLVYRIYDETAYIAVKDGSLAVKGIYDEARVSIMERIKVGHRLYTPMRYVEESMLTSVAYDSEGLINAKEKE